MFDYILFDLDGTVTDPAEGITNSVEYALNKFGIEVPDKTKLYKFIGPPLASSFAQFYGFSEEDSAKAVKLYREYYADKGIFENMLYDGIEELFKKIKAAGKKIVLATSKPEPYAIEILKHFGIYDYFDIICGSALDDLNCRKADVIAEAVRQCGAEKAKIVMVGDREFDVLGAEESGIACIGVLYGYGGEEELKGADHLTETVGGIFDYL